MDERRRCQPRGAPVRPERMFLLLRDGFIALPSGVHGTWGTTPRFLLTPPPQFSSSLAPLGLGWTYLSFLMPTGSAVATVTRSRLTVWHLAANPAQPAHWAKSTRDTPTGPRRCLKWRPPRDRGWGSGPDRSPGSSRWMETQESTHWTSDRAGVLSRIASWVKCRGLARPRCLS